jgi:hypothetical protein
VDKRPLRLALAWLIRLSIDGGANGTFKAYSLLLTY